MQEEDRKKRGCGGCLAVAVCGVLALIFIGGALFVWAYNEADNDARQKNGITPAQYESISLGMPRADVEGALGPGVLKNKETPNLSITCLGYHELDERPGTIYLFCFDGTDVLVRKETS